MRHRVLLMMGLLTCLAAGDPPAAPVAMWDLPRLIAVRERVRAGDAALMPAVERLRKDADKAAAGPPVAVTDKGPDAPAPSGDPHDYVSFAGYFWPDEKNDRAPWVMKDGIVNQTMINRYDAPRLARVMTRITDCGLAAWFTGERRHADAALEQMRRWFIDPATRMNPHMDYGQFVPNRHGGKGNEWGIIDANRFPAMLSAIALMEHDSLVPAADRAALRAWFGDWVRWLTTSGLGRKESRAPNNHGAFYDQQLAACALFIGDTALARTVLAGYGPKRIASQIEPDGSTPHEQRRAFAAMYTVWNLIGMAQTINLGKQVGIDLWAWRSADGRGLRTAADWLIPYMDGKAWTFGRNDRFKPGDTAEFFWIVASASGDEACLAQARRHGGDAANRRNLLYPLPAGR